MNMLDVERRLMGTIDCEQCAAYDCYNMADDDVDADASDFIGNLANCMATGQYWNGERLYLSAMCSPYGDGVELAVFLDDECTVYTSKAAFQDVYQQYIYANGADDLSSYAETYIKSAFEDEMPCKEMEFANPYEATDDDAAGEVSDYCAQIFDEGALDFNQCYNDNYNFGSNYNDDDELSWYTYDMTYREANDIEDVCSVVYKMSGEYSYSYNIQKSGTWYDRDASGAKKSSKSASRKSLEFSRTAIALLVLLGVGIAGTASLFSYKRRRARRMEPLYQGGAMM